jgi:hypothetical protein
MDDLQSVQGRTHIEWLYCINHDVHAIALPVPQARPPAARASSGAGAVARSSAARAPSLTSTCCPARRAAQRPLRLIAAPWSRLRPSPLSAAAPSSRRAQFLLVPACLLCD